MGPEYGRLRILLMSLALVLAGGTISVCAGAAKTAEPDFLSAVKELTLPESSQAVLTVQQPVLASASATPAATAAGGMTTGADIARLKQLTRKKGQNTMLCRQLAEQEFARLRQAKRDLSVKAGAVVAGGLKCGEQEAARQQELQALRSRLAALTEERDTLQGRAETSDARAQWSERHVREQQAQLAEENHARAEAQAVVTDLQTKTNTLSGENSSLREQLANAERTGDSAWQQLQAVAAERDRLQMKLADISSQLTAVGVLQMVQSDAVRENNVLRRSAQEATAQQKRLNAQVNSLTQQLADSVRQQDPAREYAGNVARAKPGLETEAARQAYASGVVLSRTLMRTLSLQKDLGLNTDPTLLLAGVNDGISGQVRLDKDVVGNAYDGLITRLSALEEAKYRAGEAALEKLTAGASLVKRNRTVFFVRTRKGSGALIQGDRVRFDLTESVLNGRKIRSEKGVHNTVNDRLPYVVGQALTLAGRGGAVTVYCMVSDVYLPEQIPEDLFGYSLLKITISAASTK